MTIERWMCSGQTRLPARDAFDPVTEGARHRLDPPASLALWARVCADATDAAGRFDGPRAQQQFHDAAARAGRHRWWVQPDPGRTTRVESEARAGLRGDDVLRDPVPGKRTFVEVERERQERIARSPRAPGDERRAAATNTEPPRPGEVRAMLARLFAAPPAPQAAPKPTAADAGHDDNERSGGADGSTADTATASTSDAADATAVDSSSAAPTQLFVPPRARPSTTSSTDPGNTRPHANGDPDVGSAQRESSSAAAAREAHEVAGTPAPARPPGHQSHKIKFELGRGSVTGAATITFELRETGVPLGTDQLKAIKNTVSLNLKGFVVKLETALLNAKLDEEIFDGVKVAIETSVLKVSTDSLYPGDTSQHAVALRTDLLTIAVKLQGDVGHWVHLGPQAKVTLDGQLQVALGGKLAAKLAAHTLAQLDQQMLVREMADLGDVVGKHTDAIRSIESKLAAKGADVDIAALKRELAHHKDQVRAGGRRLQDLGKQLTAGKARASRALGRLEGKLAQKVARAMEKKVARFIAGKLLKLVPILNVASTVLDLVELVQLVHALIQSGRSDDAGGADAAGDDAGDAGHPGPGSPGQPGADGRSPPPGDTTPSPEGIASTNSSDGSTSTDGHTADASHDPTQLEHARSSLPPNARAVIDSVLRDGGQGIALDPDQLRMAGLLVPDNLDPDKLQDVIERLATHGTPARSAEDLIVAIDEAVRGVCNQDRTFLVDGEPQPDATAPDAGDEVPITSPGQVDPAFDRSGVSDDATTVVYNTPPAVVGRWFELIGDEIVLSAEGAGWRDQHRNVPVADEVLHKVQHTIIQDRPGHWNIRITFHLEGATRRREIKHSYSVARGEKASDLGAKVGDLVFEPFIMIME